MRQSWLLVQICLILSGGIAEGKAQDSSLAGQDSMRLVAVDIEGNRRTKPFVILREVEVRPNQLLSSRLLDTIAQQTRMRILNTTLFSQATVRFDSIGRSEVKMKILLKENWYVWAAPYARLNDRNFSEWIDRGAAFSRLNLGAFIDHENFLGKAQKLELVLETGFTNRITLRYNVPFLFGNPNNGLLTELRYQTKASLAYNTLGNQLAFTYQDKVLLTEADLRLKWRRRVGFYSFHYLEAAYSQKRAADSLLKLNPQYLANGRSRQQMAQLAYAFRWDRRDNINFPLTGTVLIAQVARQGLLGANDYQNWQTKFAWGHYFKLKEKWYANYIVKHTANSNQAIPYNQLAGIGYEEQVLRGYDLFVANGQVYGTLRMNLKRQLLNRVFKQSILKLPQFRELPVRLFANVFVDMGYASLPTPIKVQNPLANTVLYSAGLSLELNFLNNGVVRLNMARSKTEWTYFLGFQKDIWTRWF